MNRAYLKDATRSPQSFHYTYDQPGSLPGTLRIRQNALPPELDLIDYNATNVVQPAIAVPEDCVAYLDTESVSWVDVKGLGDEETLRRLGQVFNLHPLVLEDIVNVPQRPKVEDYNDQLLIVARMVRQIDGMRGFASEQVSFIVGQHYLLTVQEEPKYDCFEPVRSRIHKGRGIIRRMGADYLTYALLDAIVDGFFPVLEAYGEQLELIEDEVILNPTRPTLMKIYQLRRELSALRRIVWSQRDAIAALLRDDSPLMRDEVQIYLRDCYDHAVQILDIVETYRESASGLMDVYLSSVSNRMNEVMKILTVISTIFIPLTFIAGVYGMNFNPDASPLNMPELNWYWGYPVVWLVMIAIAASLIYFFWRRGWFSRFS